MSVLLGLLVRFEINEHFKFCPFYFRLGSAVSSPELSCPDLKVYNEW